MDNIKCFGDSEVIIDWDKNIHGIKILLLSSWNNQPRMMINHFENISFSQVLREHNVLYDLLSIKDLLVLEDLYLFEF